MGRQRRPARRRQDDERSKKRCRSYPYSLRPPRRTRRRSAAPASRSKPAPRSGYVVGFLGSCLGVLAAVLAFNVVIDPFALAGTGIVPTAVEPDRSIKLDLLQHLKRGPRDPDPGQLAVAAGRARVPAEADRATRASTPASPAAPRPTSTCSPASRPTCSRTRSAATSGSPTSAWPAAACCRSWRRTRAPGATCRGGPRFGLGDVETYLSTDATKASWRVFQEVRARLAAARTSASAPDGSLTNQSLHYLPEHAKSLQRSVAKELAGVRARHETLAQARADLAAPGRFFYFERALAFMNRRGEVPVIVLNPVYPTVLAALSRYGLRRPPRDAGEGRAAAQALPVRVRRLRGHPHVGRQRPRLDERDARQPREHAPRCSATSSRTPTARCAEARAVLFNSYSFLFGFLPCVLAGWWGLRRWKPLRLAFLTGASWFFYAWWDWRYLPVLIGADLGRLRRRPLDRAHARTSAAGGCCSPRRWRRTSASSPTSSTPASSSARSTGSAAALGLRAPLPSLHIVLPIGISFYTFNSMSYTIDIFRRRIEPTRERARVHDLRRALPAPDRGPDRPLHRPRRPAAPADAEADLGATRRSGVFFLSCGLVKKLLIADQLDPVRRPSLRRARATSACSTGWAAAIGYSLQLYFDFSGYSDMAVGLAWLLGFRFPQNFNSPFKAENISDFWRRWHMSLSSWFRDYLFIPLGGSRHGPERTVLNLVRRRCSSPGSGTAPPGRSSSGGSCTARFLGGHAVLRRCGLTPRSVDAQPRRHLPARLRGLRDLPLAEPRRRRRRALLDGRPARARLAGAAHALAAGQVRAADRPRCSSSSTSRRTRGRSGSSRASGYGLATGHRRRARRDDDLAARTRSSTSSSEMRAMRRRRSDRCSPGRCTRAGRGRRAEPAAAHRPDRPLGQARPDREAQARPGDPDPRRLTRPPGRAVPPPATDRTHRLQRRRHRRLRPRRLGLHPLRRRPLPQPEAPLHLVRQLAASPATSPIPAWRPIRAGGTTSRKSRPTSAPQTVNPPWPTYTRYRPRRIHRRRAPPPPPHR